jgi:hypothetical protein
MRTGCTGPPDLGVDHGHDVFAAPHVQAAIRLGKVVLDVDYQERGGRVVVGHGRILEVM